MQIRKRGLENKKTQNHIGKRFNLLTVSKVSDLKREKGKVLWDCQCDCGNIKRGITSYDLKSGKVKSCGCIRAIKGKNNIGWKGYEDISGRYWNSLRRAAENRNIPFNITMEEAWSVLLKQNKKCSITGLDLKFPSDTRNTNGTASIDRIDSKKSYSIDNIQWVHKWINIMKWDLTKEEFVNMCKLVVDFNGSDVNS